MSFSDSNYVIEIIARLRDEASAGINRLNAEVTALRAAAEGRNVNALAGDIDRVGRSARNARRDVRDVADETERFNRSASQNGGQRAAQDFDRTRNSARDAAAQVERLRTSANELNAEFRRTGNVDDYLHGLQRVRQEADALARRTDIGSNFDRQFSTIANAARRSALNVSDAQRSTDKASASASRYAFAVAKLEDQYNRFDQSVKSGNRTVDDAQRGYNAFARDLESVSRQFDSGSQRAEHFAAVAARARDASNQIKIDQDAISRAEAFGHSINDIESSYGRFDQRVRDGNVNLDTARRGYSAFANELGNVSRQFRAGSTEAERFGRLAETSRGSALGIRVDADSVARAEQLAHSINDIENAYRKYVSQVGGGRTSESEAKRGFSDFASELGSVGRSFRAGSQEATRFLSIADEAGRRSRNAAQESSGSWSQFFHDLSGQGNAASGASNFFQRLSASADGFSFRLVSVSARLRGLALVGLVGFAQQLDSAIVSLAGGMTELGSAAIMAGAAIGGALISGIAQAIPLVAVLAATVGRVTSVFRASSLFSSIQEQQAANPNQQAQQQTQAANQIRDAQEGLRNAYIAVANAQQQVLDTQVALTVARRDAARQIIDLTYAERQARLEQEGDSISLQQARDNLQRTIYEGGTSTDVADAELQVRQARLALQQQTQVTTPRAVADARRAQRGGTTGRNPQVHSAEEAARQARQAVPQAQDQVRQARDALQQANLRQPAAGVSADRGQLAYLLGQFSPAERGLYDSLNRLRRELQDPSGPLRGVTDAIVAPFADGINQVSDLIRDPRVIGPLRDLSTAVGQQMEVLQRDVLGARGQQFFSEMSEDAARNVPLIGDAVRNIIHLFEDIARTAAPVLHDFIEQFDDLTAHLALRADSQQGIDKLSAFFRDAETYAEGFIHLGDALAHLFGAIIKDAAPSGLQLTDDMTDSVNRLTDWVNSHGPEVRDFFDQTRRGVEAIARILGAIGLTSLRLLDIGSLESLGSFLNKTLLPALSNVIRATGWFTQAIQDLFDRIPGGGGTLTGIVSALIGFRVVGRLVDPIYNATRAIRGLKLAMDAFRETRSIGNAIDVLSNSMRGYARETRAAAVATGELNDANLAGSVPIGGGAGAASKAAGAGAAEAEELGAAAAGGGVLSRLKGFGGSIAGRGAAGLGIGLGGNLLGGIVGGGTGSAISKVSTGAGIGALLGPEGAVAGAALGGAFSLASSIRGNRNEAQVRATQSDQTTIDNLTRRARDLEAAGNSAGLRRLFDYIGGTHSTVTSSAYGTFVEQTRNIIPETDRGAKAFDRLKTAISSDVNTIDGRFKLFYNSFQRGPQAIIDSFQNIDPLGPIIPQIGQQLQTALSAINQNFVPGSRQAARAVEAAYTGAFRSIHDAVHNGELDTDRASSAIEQMLNSRFDSINTHSKHVWPQVLSTIRENSEAIKNTLGTDSKVGAAALGANYSDGIIAVQKALASGVISTQRATRMINQLLGSELRALGITNISVSDAKAITSVDPSGLVSLAQYNRTGATGPRHGGANADGGYHAAEPGGKMMHIVEDGHDEVVLTTDPKKAPRQRALLSQYLRRAPHILNGVTRYADGGFVANPGTNFSVGQEPQIVADLRRLSRIMGETIIGISGYRTPEHSLEVGGFSDDPHTRGEAADIGVGSGLRASAAQLTSALLARVGLYRPFYPADPNEINHVQLLNGKSVPIDASAASATSGSTGGAAAPKIKAPRVRGSGLVRDIAQGAIDRVTRAANRYIQRVSGTIGVTPGAANGGGGGGTGAGVPLSVGSANLSAFSSNQKAFIQSFVNVTGLNPAVVAAWLTEEELPGSAWPSGHRDNNWLNIGNTDNKWYAGAWAGKSASEAGKLSGMWAKGDYSVPGYGSASSGIISFSHTAGESAAKQIAALQNSGWALSGYPGFTGVYDRFVKKQRGGQIGAGYGGGDRVPALLEDGEHVWTREEVANAGGHGVMYAARAMFGGGKQASGRAMRDGGVPVPSIAVDENQSLDQLVQTVTRSLASLRNIPARSRRFASSFTGFTKFVDNLVKDDGVFDQLANAFTTLQSRLQDASARVTFGTTRIRTTGGKLVTAGRQRRTATQQAYRQVEVDSAEGTNLNDQESIYDRTLSRIRQRISATRLIRNRSARSDRLSSIEANYNRVIRKKQSVDDQIAQNLQDTYSDTSNALQSELNDISNEFGTGFETTGRDTSEINRLRTLLRRATRTGNRDLSNQIRQQIFQTQQSQVQRQLSDIGNRYGTQQGAIQTSQAQAQAFGQTDQYAGFDQQLSQSYSNQIQDLQAPLRRAQKMGDRDTVAQITQQIQQLQQSIAQAAAQMITDEINNIDTVFGRTDSSLQSSRSIQESLGNRGALAGIDQQILSNTNAHISSLQGELARASAAGDQAGVDQITQEIQQLQDTATQTAVQIVQDQIDTIQTQAQYTSNAVDRQNRIAAVQRAAGNPQAAAATERAGLLTQQSSIEQQQVGYQAALATALANGDTGDVQDLQDRLADLSVQMQENTEALRDNSTELRQTYIDQTTRQVQLGTGVYGGLTSIIQTLGQISGSQDVGTLIGLGRRTGQSLRTAGGQYASELLNLTNSYGEGVNLQGLTGTALVRAIENLDLNGLETNMTEGDREQFEGLINSIVSNEGALDQNTQQLAQLNGQLTEFTISTTAFTRFRQSIFNGSGGLLPEYQIPSLDTGTPRVMSDGMAYIHRDEAIIPAQVVRGGDMPNMGVSGGDQYHVHVTNPTETTDPDYIARRLAWQLRTT